MLGVCVPLGALCEHQALHVIMRLWHVLVCECLLSRGRVFVCQPGVHGLPRVPCVLIRVVFVYDLIGVHAAASAGLPSPLRVCVTTTHM